VVKKGKEIEGGDVYQVFSVSIKKYMKLRNTTIGSIFNWRL